ncbi:MAG: TlpA disulfide reductase family protein [Bacteroidota bacterium]|nr:TlpA disulfide reductase family protein [Bacteroidota bacterium]
MVIFKNFAITLILLGIIIGCETKEKVGSDKNNENVFPLLSVQTREGIVPDFSWNGGDGKTNNFDSFRKEVTLVNFWATWCAPCKKELPDLVAINEEFASKGVKVIGISTDKGTNVISEVSDFLNENKVSYMNIVDNGELASAFGNIRGIPTTFLINKEGKIVDRFVGIRTKDFFVEQINQLLQ